MPAKKTSDQAIAVIRIDGIPDMTARQRKTIADWMIKQALSIVKDGPLYDAKFTARYLER